MCNCKKLLNKRITRKKKKDKEFMKKYFQRF